MRKLIGIPLFSLSLITLIACSKSNYQSLDGEYYWISSERNELAFTIKGNNASIEHGEADSFTINKQKNTIELTGQNIANRIEKYSFKYPFNQCQHGYGHRCDDGDCGRPCCPLEPSPVENTS